MKKNVVSGSPFNDQVYRLRMVFDDNDKPYWVIERKPLILDNFKEIERVFALNPDKSKKSISEIQSIADEIIAAYYE